MTKLDPAHIKSLQDYLADPITRVHDEEGRVSPDFADLADPFTGQAQGPAVGARKAELEKRRLLDLLRKHGKLNQ